MNLDDIRRGYFERFPDLAWLDMALKSDVNRKPFFYFRDIPSFVQDLNGATLAMARLGKNLEERFAFHGEVAVYLLPWKDFQKRAFIAIATRNAEISAQVQGSAGQASGTASGASRYVPSSQLVVVLSPDPTIAAKVKQWQDDVETNLIVVPLATSFQDKDSAERLLVDRMIQFIGDRDLYKTDQPVEGGAFFGRGELIEDIYSALKGRQYVNLLGLRRLGKTSIIHQLAQVSSRRKMVVVKADLQSARPDSIETIPGQILTSMVDRLQERRSRGESVWTGDIAKSVGDLRPASTVQNDIIRLAKKNSSLHFVVALDEIETAYAMSKEHPHHIKSFFGLFRAAVQGASNISLMFSGVANDMFDRSTLGEAERTDNPLFRQVTPFYVNPFSLDETGDLLDGLGRPSLLSWTDGAIELVHELTGGIPLLVRGVASRVRAEIYPQQEVRRVSDYLQVGTEDVLAAATGEWRTEAAEIWNEIVEALGIHYPAAALLLDSKYSEDDLRDITQGDRDFTRAADILRRLGILESTDPVIRFSGSYKSLRSLTGPQLPGKVTSMLTKEERSFVDEAVSSAESESLEFKETGRYCLREKARRSYVEESVLKTVAAFLNTGSGGDLLIGVGDDGKLMGLGKDLSLFKGASTDEFERWLTKDLLGRKLGTDVVAMFVGVKFPIVRGIQICWVKVRRADRPIKTADGLYYLRLGNQTLKMTPDE